LAARPSDDCQGQRYRRLLVGATRGDKPPWHGARILVVEDSHFQAEITSDFLKVRMVAGPAQYQSKSKEL
jgi:hypothetical protein